jgi:hypothetical protein
MIPSDILVLEKIPVLDTGKIDYLAVTKLTQQHLAQKAIVAA